MELLEIFISYGLIGLFAIGLVSSIIPVPTEMAVLGLIDIGKNPQVILIVLATSSIVGAFLGYLVGKHELRKIIPFHDKEKEERMQAHFRKYGALFLFVSPWIPLIGDIAPVVAGIENYETRKFLTVISIAKTVKSIAIVYFMVYFSFKMDGWWEVLVNYVRMLFV